MIKPVVFEITQTECYCGAKGDEYPRSFKYSDQQVVISEILDRWYESGVNRVQPVYNYFKIKSDKGDLYLLRYNIFRKIWSVKKLDF